MKLILNIMINTDSQNFKQIYVLEIDGIKIWNL